MSFRKRNVGLSRGTAASTGGQYDLPKPSPKPTAPQARGVQPSPIDGRPTLSTGASSLDTLLAGHSGLPLGSSLLIEESGTTDYAGSLLRYFAAEGIAQGHHIHLTSLGDRWIRDLPGIVGVAEESTTTGAGKADEKMKIAWRYESLGRVQEQASPRRNIIPNRNIPTRGSQDRGESDGISKIDQLSEAYCHVFDLSKRLEIPADARITHYPTQPDPQNSLLNVIHQIARNIDASAPGSIHRILIPGLLSPALFPPQAAEPHNFIQFFHSLRALLRRYPATLAAMTTLPLSLHPRMTALVRWAEILSDGTVELTPFPHRFDDHSVLASGGKNTGSAADDQPQGLVKIHKLPVFHERGGGGGVQDLGSDLSFTVSRRKFAIKSFSLPPADGDIEAQKEAGSLTKDQIDF